MIIVYSSKNLSSEAENVVFFLICEICICDAICCINSSILSVLIEINHLFSFFFFYFAVLFNFAMFF